MKHPINYMRFVTIPITLKIRKATAFTNTTLAPAGVEYKNETVIPIKKQATEIIPDEINMPAASGTAGYDKKPVSISYFDMETGFLVIFYCCFISFSR